MKQKVLLTTTLATILINLIIFYIIYQITQSKFLATYICFGNFLPLGIFINNLYRILKLKYKYIDIYYLLVSLFCLILVNSFSLGLFTNINNNLFLFLTFVSTIVIFIMLYYKTKIKKYLNSKRAV